MGAQKRIKGGLGGQEHHALCSGGLGRWKGGQCITGSGSKLHQQSGHDPGAGGSSSEVEYKSSRNGRVGTPVARRDPRFTEGF